MKKTISYLIEFYKESPSRLYPIGILVSVIIILFFGLPNEILYAKEGILEWVPFIIIFALTPWRISRVLIPHNISKDHIQCIYCAAILILGPSFGFWSGIQAENDLKLNGKLAIGVMYKKWLSHGNSEDEWLVRCYFSYKGEKYSTFSEEDVFNQFQTGDSLMIRFSANFPDNNRIVGLNEKVKTN